ncbi:hypothetical protein JT358_14605 [Micrococcales bacterium 31B]|nr:hypothetical protein [Micrococcales bacterium 31B]
MGGRHRATGASGLAADQGGVLILGIGLTFVVMLFIAVGVALSGLYVQQRQLEDLADGAATYAAQQASFEASTQTCAFGVCHVLGDAALTDSQAELHAREYLRRVSGSNGGDLAGVSLLPGTTVGRTQGGQVRVNLSLAGRANPPLIGWLTSQYDGGIAVTAISRAGLFEQ